MRPDGVAIDLSQAVVLVAGAGRGVGRRIAQAFAEAGAAVVVTGRAQDRRDLDQAAAEVTRLGGRGEVVPCDHTRVEDVRALAETVRRRHGRLDVLVNAVWDGAEAGPAARPFWEQPLALWDATQRPGAWAALLTTRFLAPLLVGSAGLVVTVTIRGREGAVGSVYRGLASAALAQLACVMADDFRPHGVTSVAAAPGAVRTERALAQAGVSARRWTRAPSLAGSESPRFLGRGLAALAVDPARFAVTGQTVLAADLARRYGVTDLNGSQPGPSQPASD